MKPRAFLAATILCFAAVCLPQGPYPGTYRSPAGRHKVRIPVTATDAKALAAAARTVSDYGEFVVAEVDDSQLASLAAAPGVEVRDDYNLVLLNTGAVDTTGADAARQRAPVGAFAGKRLHLVQFAGPVTQDWHDGMRKSGCQIITYIPHNAYLVYGDAASLGALQSAARVSAHVQWDGPYKADHVIQPGARTVDAKGQPRTLPTDMFTVQLVADPEANIETITLIEALALAPIVKQQPFDVYLNIVVRLPADRLADIAARPDVVSIALRPIPTKNDERQDLIVSGNISGNTPNGPGYLAWLTGKGFSQSQFTASGFAVDVTDSGVDNATQAPNHPGLRVDGETTGASRVVYNRLEGSPNSGSTLQGCDGHGNLNAHIIGGFNAALAGFPFTDSAAYHFGLGVCPWVKVGSTVIFDPDTFTYPSYASVQSKAYHDGARMSSNSWGADTWGEYDADAQEYDALVRDAQPSGSPYPVAGNQQMTIVFAAGNAGSSLGSVGSPGTAKNVITVGASENVHSHSTANGGNSANGSDGCSVYDTEADSLNDVASFSSRGPCYDSRKKPDIMAPGTHVTGGVAQASPFGSTGTALACFDGTGVCALPGGGAVGSPNNFFPMGQQFYSTSSGTSHATPAVAGGAALVRQFFNNNGFAAPSPAMIKAVLMNAARHMTGTSANDTLWSNVQGMGLMDLGRAFDDTHRIRRDQIAGDKFTASGQSRVITGQVADSGRPLRVTLAWTDAPGATSGNAYRNDLDLLVTVGGQIYRGNSFSGAYSVAGGSADPCNNVESVFVSAGTTGSISVRVTASNINSDGVPNDADSLDQDYALVVYNADQSIEPVIGLSSAGLASEGCTPGNGKPDPDEAVTFNLALQNTGTTATANLVATLTASGGVAWPSAPQTYGALAAGGSAVSRPFSFTAVGTCGAVVTATLELTDNGVPMDPVVYLFQLGTVGTPQTFSYTGPAVAIPDANSAGVNVPVTVSGLTGPIVDLDFRFDGATCSADSGATGVGLDHTYVGDLVTRLTSPSGKTVTLISRSGASGNNFCQTILDDEAGGGSIQSIESYEAPFSGSFTPASPLSAFDGENPNGTWTLNVSDVASIDTGNVRAFSLLISQPVCCESVAFQVLDDETFSTDVTNPTPGSTTGWTPFSSNQTGQVTDYDAANGALRVTIGTATSLRSNGWVTANSEWLPYTSIGTGRIVRGKFHVFRAAQADPADLNQVPNLRLRLSTRFAVNSMLEVFSHLSGDSVGTSAGHELVPGANPSAPSVYRVDFDPVDVPMLNVPGEGVSRGFEAYCQEPQENGSLELTESVVGVYPVGAMPDTGPAVLAARTYAVSASDAGDLKIFNSLTDGPFLRKFVLVAPGVFGSEVALDGSTDPTHSEGSAGVTLDSTAVASNRVGFAVREFTQLGANTQRIRVEPGRQYKLRWHVVSTTNANRNPQLRLRARALKFMWSQKLEIGGALSAGTNNNTIAQQSLPGVGSANPDQRTIGEPGGWYSMVLHTPMSTEIRSSQLFLDAQPGPGDPADSIRDVKFGIDLVDTLSGMTASRTEAGRFVLDAVEIRAYELVPD